MGPRGPRSETRLDCCSPQGKSDKLDVLCILFSGWKGVLMSISHFLLGAAVFTVAAVGGWAAGAEADKSDQQAREMILRHETVVRPLEIEAGRAGWTANLDGTDENYRKKEELETRLDLLLADPAAFARAQGRPRSSAGRSAAPRESKSSIATIFPNSSIRELLKKTLAESNFVERTFNVFRPRRRRQGVDRQRGPPRADRVEGFRPAQGRLGSEQGGRPASGRAI